MTEEYKKYICSNCSGKCEKGIIIVEEKGTKSAKCADYKKKNEIEGYKKPIMRTAKQIKPIMRFTQEY